jgi:hypothetical protein
MLSKFSRCLLVGALAVSGGGCGLSEPSQVDIVRPEWLTPGLRSALTPQGIFASVSNTVEYPQDLNLAESEALATVFVRTIHGRPGGLEADILETHGGPIDFPALRICGRSFYMKSSFQPLDATIQADGLRSGIEARWLMTFCSPSGTPTIVHNQRAATHATAANGVLVVPPEAAGDFFTSGVPLSRPSLVRSPETAVARVYAVTETRISKLPEMFHDLVSVGPTGANGRPFDPYWKVEIESPVTVATTAQGSIQSRVFYVLAYSVLFDAAVYVAGATPLPPFWVTSSGAPVLVTPREPLNFERVLTDK